MNWGFAFLAYGGEHIIEFNRTGRWIKENLPDTPIWVGTDSPESIDETIGANIILIEDEFNFNLKLLPIREALNWCDSVWVSDTDIHFRNYKFDSIDSIPEGIHPISILNESELGDINGNYEYMKEYLKTLHEIHPGPLRLILEYGFIIRKGDRTKQFLDLWESLDKETRKVQHQQYGLKGASEGLIIWIAATKTRIQIHEGSIRELWNSVAHFGKQNQKGIRTTI